MVDSEDIIRAVKQHKAIWNLQDESYHNKRAKEDAWDDVCFDVFKSEWCTFSYEEKIVKQLDLKRRWNNIRDYYKKLLAEQRPGSRAEIRAKKRRYLYSEILEFMRPVYEKKRPDGQNADNSSNDDKYISIHMERVTSSSHQAPEEIDSENSEEKVTFIDVPARRRSHHNPYSAGKVDPQGSLRRPQIRKKLPQPLTFFERSMIRRLEKVVKEKDCPDLLFLKSLLPDMQKLTDNQKFDFKLGILELYKNITMNGPADVAHDHDYDAEDLPEVKVESIHLSVEEDYQSL